MFVEFPVSGLNRLFNRSPSSATLNRDHASIESVSEEVYTRNLLYPTLEALQTTQPHAPFSRTDSSLDPPPLNTFNDWCELGIDEKDIRVLIAQDGNAISQQPRVLYNSTPPLSSPRFSVPQNKTKNAQSRLAPVDQPRSNPTHKDQLTSDLTPSHWPALADQPPARVLDRDEQLGAFDTSRFRKDAHQQGTNDVETSQMKATREEREQLDTLLGCMFGSSGLPLVSSTKIHVNPIVSTNQAREAMSIPALHEIGPRRSSPKKRTPLYRSITSEGSTLSNGLPTPTNSHVGSGSSCAPSILVTRVFAVESPVSSAMESETHSRNGLEDLETMLPQPQAEKVKQIKVPQYAVSLVIQMPLVLQLDHRSLPRSNRSTAESSEDSHISTVSPTADYGASASHVDVERITAHWHILIRALSSLERIARAQIHRLLLKVDRPQVSTYNPTSSNTIMWQKKPRQSSQRIIQLPHLALQENAEITNAAAIARYRVSYALKINRVVCGQNRWGVWKNETRCINERANDKDHNFFLFNLLTAFLGNHTEWLEELGAEWTGRNRVQQEIDEAQPIHRRTVVISTNKFAARRLLFILSAFLPSTNTASYNDKFNRPFSSRSSSGFSQSPPYGVPLSREISLRRKINRKQRDQRSHRQVHTHERSVSFSATDSTHDDDQLLKLIGHHRRTSDTRSVRSLALPIPLGVEATRKGSISTISTPMPHSAVPIPHFSGFISDKAGTSAVPRPGSSGSLASLSLRRTLSRSDSSGGVLIPESPTTSRWGSILSGFWSSRRASSTEGTENFASPTNGFAILGMPNSTSPRSPSKLARMVEEAAHRPSITGESDQDTLQGPPSPGTITEATPARDIPERQNPEDFPLKLSIDVNDGVVDIELPSTGSYASSLASSVDSPQMVNTTSSSFNDHSSLYGRTSTHSSLPSEHTSTIDVAGYLRHYHPDFTLQAVQPYNRLKEDVKRSMQDEHIPLSNLSNEFTDVCTTLLADTCAFTVTRLNLRRNRHGEELFTEEPVMDLDPTLTDVVERFIADRPQSRDHSPSHKPEQGASNVRHSQANSGPELPRVEHKGGEEILLALGAIAKSVAREYESYEQGHDINPGERKAGARVDSSLREGVRTWLRERSHT